MRPVRFRPAPGVNLLSEGCPLRGRIAREPFNQWGAQFKHARQAAQVAVVADKCVAPRRRLTKLDQDDAGCGILASPSGRGSTARPWAASSARRQRPIVGWVWPSLRAAALSVPSRAMVSKMRGSPVSAPGCSRPAFRPAAPPLRAWGLLRGPIGVGCPLYVARPAGSALTWSMTRWVVPY
jgi:hypothetical protein